MTPQGCAVALKWDAAGFPKNFGELWKVEHPRKGASRKKWSLAVPSICAPTNCCKEFPPTTVPAENSSLGDDGETPAYAPSYSMFEREDIAFRQMLPVLLKTKPAMFVAFKGGRLIDEDGDGFRLAERIEQIYQGFVLIRQVTREERDDQILSPEE